MGRTQPQQNAPKQVSSEEAKAAEQPLDTREIQQVAMMPPHEYKGIMQAKIAKEADEIKNETEPGGKFMVDDTWVDANGNPLDKKKDEKAEE